MSIRIIAARPVAPIYGPDRCSARDRRLRRWPFRSQETVEIVVSVVACVVALQMSDESRGCDVFQETALGNPHFFSWDSVRTPGPLDQPVACSRRAPPCLFVSDDAVLLFGALPWFAPLVPLRS